MEKAIEVKDLTVTYNEVLALQDVTVAITSQKITGIIGPNGSGKSTLLKSILGIVPTRSGEVRFFGSDLDAVRMRVAYVPQRESIDWNFPISVREVVEMGRMNREKWWAKLTTNDHDLVQECLKQVQMDEFANRTIGALSGGQQQRVFIARALAQQADLIIMDEPFVGIDMRSQEAILSLVKQLRDAGKTIVIVHHDLSVVAQNFDEVILLNHTLIAHGSSKEIMTPEILERVYGISFNLNQ